jgi:hypothetical protein
MVLLKGYTDVFPKRQMWEEIAKELIAVIQKAPGSKEWLSSLSMRLSYW